MSYRLIVASAHQTGLPDKSVHCIITSPPYKSLRKYEGNQEIDWQEMSYSPMAGMPPITIPAHRCALGLEKEISSYIGHLVLVLREIWRVLRDDGSLFWNISDSYSGSTIGGGNGASLAGTHHAQRTGTKGIGQRNSSGIRPKNLMGVPQRFFLAAQAEGWIMRQAMPWLKRNQMPDSTTDRPGGVVESIFLMTKNERYFWDAEAVKQPASDWGSRQRIVGEAFTNGVMPNGQPHKGLRDGDFSERGRNFRSSDLFFKTWEGMLLDDCGDPMAMVINPKGYSGQHFAAFPPELPEMAILAGTSAYGVCAKCGAPYRRCVEKTPLSRLAVGANNELPKHNARQEMGLRSNKSGLFGSNSHNDSTPTSPVVVTTGWAQSCSCPAHAPIPATVADFFSGSGTTLMVAQWLGRDAIGIDLSDEYHTLAHERINTPREKVEDKRAPHPELQRGLFEGIVL